MIPLRHWCEQHGLSERSIRDALRADPTVVPLPTVKITRQWFVLDPQEAIALNLQRLADAVGSGGGAGVAEQPAPVSLPHAAAMQPEAGEQVDDADRLVAAVDDLPVSPARPFTRADAAVALDAVSKRRRTSGDAAVEQMVSAITYGMVRRVGDTHWRDRFDQGDALTSAEYVALLRESKDQARAALVTQTVNGVLAAIRQRHPNATLTHAGKHRETAMGAIVGGRTPEMIVTAVRMGMESTSTYLSDAAFPTPKRLTAMLQNYDKKFAAITSASPEIVDAAAELAATFEECAQKAGAPAPTEMQRAAWRNSAAECLMALDGDTDQRLGKVRMVLRFMFAAENAQWQATADFPTWPRLREKMVKAQSWARGDGHSQSSVMAADRGGRQQSSDVVERTRRREGDDEALALLRNASGKGK